MAFCLYLRAFFSASLSGCFPLSLGGNTKIQKKLREENEALELVEAVVEVGLVDEPSVRLWRGSHRTGKGSTRCGCWDSREALVLIREVGRRVL